MCASRPNSPPGRIKPAEAIDALEQLRYRWRGDALELSTLRKLGNLYFAQKRWREGLGVLRVAALNFANTDLGREAQDDMRHAFADLFLRGKADAMRPIEALSLFYDFIELTPIGADGDEMIRRLSDRLVAVDLLAPAEQLLDHQVHEAPGRRGARGGRHKARRDLSARPQAQGSARHDQRHAPDAASRRDERGTPHAGSARAGRR